MAVVATQIKKGQCIEFSGEKLIVLDLDHRTPGKGNANLRLKHRLDVVLIDKYSPFGNEKLLPRGTLREPPKNLKRASYIFITKCDGSSTEALIKRIRKYNRTAEIIECAHKPKYLENI